MSDRGTTEDHAPRSKKRKPVVVPERPHRPLNAYNLFFADERKRMIQEAGGKDSQKAKMGFADMARSVSKRWKLVSEDDKAHYLRLAAIDKQRYYREMNEWYRLNNEESPEGEDSSSPEKSENEDDRKPSPLVQVQQDDEDKGSEDPSVTAAAGLKAAPQEHTQKSAVAMPAPQNTSTGLGVAASMQDLRLAHQRLQNDVYASALNQQANLLSLPGDFSNVNTSSHNAGLTFPSSTYPQQEHLRQFLEPQAASRNQQGATSSVTTPSNPSVAAPVAHASAQQQMIAAGGLGSSPHADIAYLQLLQKLHHMQQQQSAYAAAPTTMQTTHQASFTGVPAPAYAASSPAGLLNTSIRPIQHDAPYGTTAGSSHTSSRQERHPTRSTPPFQEHKHQASNETSPTSHQESKTDRIAAAANYLSSVAAASSPRELQDSSSSSNGPRGSIRQHLNAMISMGGRATKQQQQQQQQQEQQEESNKNPPGEIQEKQQASRPRQQYQSLASNLGDDALSFFVNTFLEEDDAQEASQEEHLLAPMQHEHHHQQQQQQQQQQRRPPPESGKKAQGDRARK